VSIVAPTSTADLSTPMRVRIDGTVTDLSGPTTVGGITLTPFTHAVQIDLPDGTRAWAISVAPYGINLEVKPSALLRADGQGLLAHRSANGVGLPLLPDGTAIPRPTAAGELDHLLYERFAGAWRITQADSAFDYDPGTSTATYSQPYLPSHAASVHHDAIATAASACQGIADANATADCTEDVILTGDTGFARQARTLGVFFSRGVSHLDDVGTGTGTGSTTPPPGDTSGTAAATPVRGGTFSITPVTGMPAADMVMIDGAPRQTVGPDESVFIENILPADAQHDAIELDWIGSDGSVKSRLKRGEQRGDIIGFTYAAGSLWLETSTATSCTVHRLNPERGNEEAHLDVSCVVRVATGMATFHDAPWFVGKTDAGPLLGTIDTTTNRLGTVVQLKPTDPATGRITATEAALFYGDGDAIRIDPTAGTETVVLDDTHGRGTYPAGDGVWTEADDSGTITFSNAPGGPQRTLTITGELLAANGHGLWTERHADGLPYGQDGGGIYHSALDGSGTRQVSPDELYGFPWGSHPMPVPGGFVLVVAGSNAGSGMAGFVYERLDAG
jgi:hypothetical protein